MRELQALLAERNEQAGADVIDFDAEKNRVRCYAHIINICSSHIVSSLSSTPNPRIFDSSTHDDSDDSDDWDDIVAASTYDINRRMRLDSDEDDAPRPKDKGRAVDTKGDPLKRARTLVRFLRSSDERKLGFQKYIRNGNSMGLFHRLTDGKYEKVQVPEVEPIRDVRTRWDSAYLMVLRLRLLQPVSVSPTGQGCN
jgi:hypothetical protein